jgi:hypothetical protein
MAGNDHIDTAPKDTIGDDGDLRQMRDALRAGKTVTLAYDGKVYISPEAKAPMTGAHENFIESKLGHVIELARQGYGVTVHPDGEISADRADHLSKVMYDPDPALSEQQRGLIERGVSEGAQVRVHSDGRVEYFLARDAVAPSADQAAELRAWVKAEIDSGRLGTAMQNGETMSLNPNGSVDYIHTAPGPDPVQFPDGGVPAQTPTMSAEDMDAEAKALELGAGAARINAQDDYETEATAAVTRRDTAELDRDAAQARMESAERQVVEKQAVLERIQQEQAEVAARAVQLRDSGDLTGAEEQAEKWYRMRAEERVAATEVGGAQKAFDTSRNDYLHRAQDVRTGESDAGAAFTKRQRLEDVFDEQEDQARAYRGAATELREAQRLEEAYADLSARGVAGAERVKEAAAQHRAKADELGAKARAFDDQGVPTSQLPMDDGSDAGTDQAAVAAVTAGVDIDIDIEIPSVDATASSATMDVDVDVDVDTTTTSADPPTVADDVDIEMPSTDFGADVPAVADVEIEMPAMDFGSESSVVGDVAQFDPAADGSFSSS